MQSVCFWDARAPGPAVHVLFLNRGPRPFPKGLGPRWVAEWGPKALIKQGKWTCDKTPRPLWGPKAPYPECKNYKKFSEHCGLATLGPEPLAVQLSYITDRCARGPAGPLPLQT